MPAAVGERDIEAAIFLAVFGAVVLLAAAFVVGLIALIRTQRVDALGRRITALEGELVALKRAAAPAAPPSGVAPAAPPPGAAPAAPAPTPPVPPPAPAKPPPAAAPPPAAPAAAAASKKSPLSSVQWERWIGVRGAAVLGGIFLALAGLLLFQYSIEKGLITPALRVAIGIGAGVLSVVGSEILHRKRFAATANALAGGGVVALYAAFWAAHSLYGLWSFPLSFACMAAVTALCCVLALKNSSQLIAALGLLGGFATPLVLASSQDRPIGLFGYLLLLDLGFLLVGRRRSWPALGLVAVLGTTLIEALWVGARMDPARLALGLVIVGTFGALFAVVGGRVGAGRGRWLLSQAAGVLTPFAFAIYFASHVELGRHLLPTAALAAVLAVASGVLARRQVAPWLPLGAAAGALAVVGVWVGSSSIDASRALELAGSVVLIALAFHAFVERAPRGVAAGAEKGISPEDVAALQRGHALAAILATLGLLGLAILACAKAGAVGPVPWLASFLALMLLAHRLAAKSGYELVQVGAALAVGVGMSVYQGSHADDDTGWFPAARVFFGLLIAIELALLLLALPRRSDVGRRWAWRAAAAYALPVLLSLDLTNAIARAPTALVLGSAIALTLCAATATALARSGGWFAAVVAASAASQFIWTFAQVRRLATEDDLGVAFAIELAGLAALTLWPLGFRKRLEASPWAWGAAALAAWLWFPELHQLYREHFGRDAIGVLPLLLALPSAAVALALRRGPLRTPLAWHAAVATSFLCLALPLQLDRQVWLVALALWGAALAVLGRRLDVLALRYLALVATAAAGAGLMALSVQPYTFAHSEERLFNWISYAYLVPAASAVVAASLLRTSAIHATIAGLASVGLVFCWITLEIFNAWSTDGLIEISFERVQDRDLVLSLAWALYALVLLGLGVVKRIGALRWVSLGLFVLTIGKVFLFDLGNLEGLYRVGSLFGLAVALLLVSLVYQRFVFRKSWSS